MHIGLIIYGSLETETGGYLYDRMVTRGLMARGHTVDVISLTGGSYVGQIVHGLSPAIYRRLQDCGVDVLVQDELCHPSLFVVNRRLRRQGGPLIVALVHHVRCREPGNRWLNALLAVVERRYLASVDGFIHNSETTRRTVAALTADHRPEVVAYPAGNRFGNPLSVETIEQRAFRPGPLALLFVGLVIPRKGLLALLNDLARVDRDYWCLTVVGRLDLDPDYVTKARQRIRQLGLSDSVRLHGFCNDHELVEVMQASHIFCMPYAYEGYGIAMLEAMAFGLPAIGSREGAARETIRHGTNGFLLAPGDLGGLAPLLSQLYHEREVLLQMSLAARATFTGRPTWQESTAKIDGFLQRMVSLKRRGTLNDPA